MPTMGQRDTDDHEQHRKQQPVRLADNFPPGSEGGGIYNGAGIMTITNSVVSNNDAGVPGPNFPTVPAAAYRTTER